MAATSNVVHVAVQATALDRAVRELVAATPAAVEALLGVLTWLGSGWVVFPVALLAAALLRRWIEAGAWLIVATPAAAALANLFLKELIGRARPTAVTNLLGVSHSLPSGHATTSTAAYLFLAYLLVREGLARRWVVAAGGAVPLVVGASRVVLDVHWATDVLAGWLLGLLVALAGLGAYRRMEATGRSGTDGPGPAGAGGAA